MAHAFNEPQCGLFVNPRQLVQVKSTNFVVRWWGQFLVQIKVPTIDTYGNTPNSLSGSLLCNLQRHYTGLICTDLLFAQNIQLRNQAALLNIAAYSGGETGSSTLR